MPGQNQFKGSKKLWMAKKARIRACPEEEATGTAMADCLGRQKLTKENLAGQVFLCPEGSLKSSKLGEI
jgi:hypothetical protein